MFKGLIRVYDKTGRAVKVSSSNTVVLSEDVRGATTFQLVGCRAWNDVPEELYPRCVSLMDANRTDWYVRHTGYYLHVDPEYNTYNPSLFKLVSSFILHSDTFFPNLYALESVNYPNFYVKSDDNGRLKIVHSTNITDYDTASFRMSSEYIRLVL